MESDNIVDAGNMTNKTVIFITVFNSGSVIFVLHYIHDSIPIFLRKILASFTW